MALIDDLISYWKCDEASGNLLDAHGGHDLIDRNTVGSGTGKIGGGRDFVRANSESFDIADNADLSMGDIAMSGHIWVKLDTNAATQVLLCKGNDVTTTALEYAVYFSSASGGRFVFRVCGGVTNSQVTANNFGAPSLGVWYYVFFYHDPSANVIGISVNNGTPNTASHTAGINNGSNSFYLGWDVNSARYFDGVLDEIAIWKAIKTTTERTELYNGGNGLAYPFSLGQPAIRRYSADALRQYEIGREGVLVA